MTPEEREDILAKGLCFFCHKAGHVVKECLEQLVKVEVKK